MIFKEKMYRPYTYEDCGVALLREDLKSFLSSKKISKAQFAELAKVSEITLVMFLKNKRDTRAENVHRIRCAFVSLLSKTYNS